MSNALYLSRRHGNRRIAGWLRAERRKLSVTSFSFFDVDFDRDIADALLAVLRLSVRAGRAPLESLCLFQCRGNEFLDLVLEAAVATSVFAVILIRAGEGFYSAGQSDAILIPGDSIKSRDIDEQEGDCDEKEEDCDEEKAAEDDHNEDEGSGMTPPSLLQQHEQMSFRPFGVPLRLCRCLRRLQLTQVTLSNVEMKLLGQALMGGWDGNGADQTYLKTDNGHVLNGKGMQYPNRQSLLGLISLELSSTDLFGVEEHSFNQFCIGLRNSPSLQDLSFDSCNLTDGHIEQIIHALMDGTSTQRCRSNMTEPALPPLSSTWEGTMVQESSQWTPAWQCGPPSQPHGSLKLRLIGGQCHQQGFRAIDQWLSRPDCSLELLEISQPWVLGHTVGVGRIGTVRGVTDSSNGQRRHEGGQVGHDNNSHEDPDASGINGRNGSDVNHLASTTNGVSMGLKLLAQNWDTLEPASSTFWSPNTSLKVLRLCRNQLSDDDMPALAELVQNRLPGLEELNLEYNKITSAGLASFAHESAQRGTAVNEVHSIHGSWGPGDNLVSGSKFSPSRLSALSLEGNDFVPNLASTSVVQILHVYADLRSVTPRNGWDKETQELLDFSSGAYLLMRHVPLGLWPLVFARVSARSRGFTLTSRIARLYHLLRHSPLLLTRAYPQSIKLP
jgi:hypothetical protein